MELWKISQTKNNTYDTYDSAIVAADTAEEACRMHPENGRDITTINSLYFQDLWVSVPSYVRCIYLGEAKNNIKKGVILASFNGS